MSEESEEVLEEDWVSPSCGVEEGSVDVSVSEEYGNSGGEYWECAD